MAPAEGRDSAGGRQGAGPRGRQRSGRLHMEAPFGRVQPADVRRLRQLEIENAKLKRIVAERDLSL